MVEFGDGVVSITFGDYGDQDHIAIAEEIQVHLERYEEHKDFLLYLRGGDEVASGMELFNLRLFEDSKLRNLINYFTNR